jgi:hypothetical protein
LPAEIDPALARVLGALAAELGACREPWWLIGSAAMAVHGAPVEVRDVDLLLGRPDAEAFLARRGMAAKAGVPSELFSSALFAAWPSPPFTVELFAGFRVREGKGWRRLAPETREMLEIGDASICVPGIAELIAWGRLFGRSKDAAREPLLRALLPPAGLDTPG